MSSGSSQTGQSRLDSKLEAFIADYYEHLAGEDTQGHDVDVLRARANHHWQVARNRTPKTANVEIRNESGRSIVYIVTDDMPFLVDSVNAELGRQHLAIHLVVHPLLSRLSVRSRYGSRRLRSLTGRRVTLRAVVSGTRAGRAHGACTKPPREATDAACPWSSLSVIRSRPARTPKTRPAVEPS